MTQPPTSPERDAAAPSEPWVVWSDKHQAWWGPDRIGYNIHLLAAGIYTEAEAKSIEKMRSPKAEVARPLADALKHEWQRIEARPGTATVGRHLQNQFAELRSDRDRLDWLDKRVQVVASADGTEHIANTWGVYGQCYALRKAIDAEMEAEDRAARSPIREESNG